MGINVSYRSDLNCGTDHPDGRGWHIECPGHKVVAEWHRTSNICMVSVDGQELRMQVELFDALLDAMKVVRE